MHRFLTNFSQAKVHLISPQKDSSARNKIYDQNKRKRTFVASWRQEFPWATEIETCDGQKVIVCSLCREYDNVKTKPSANDLKENTFLYGSVAYRKSSLETHSTSVNHRVFVRRQSNELLNEPCRTKLASAFSDAEKDRLFLLFKNSYGVLKAGKPWTDYTFFCKLDKAKGLDIGNTYINRISGMNFGRYIAHIILKELSKSFWEAKFFTIIIDEATDASHKEQVVLYVRFSSQGQISTKYCGLFNVNRANARQICDGLLVNLKLRLGWGVTKQLFVDNDVFENPENRSINNEDYSGEIITTQVDSYEDTTVRVDSENALDSVTNAGDMEIDLSDVSDDELDEIKLNSIHKPASVSQPTDITSAPLLVGMVSDGASVLSGKIAGVQALLSKEVNPHLLYVWCISHRLQLALKDCIRSCKQFNDLHEFLQSLYKYHANSNVVNASFRSAVEVKGRKGACAVIRVDGTRWVSHMLHALTNVLNAIDCHHDQLVAIQEADRYSELQKGKARYFYKHLTDNVFVEVMVFILDVLRELSKFSMLTQKADMTFPAVQFSLTTLLERITLLKTKGGKSWTEYQDPQSTLRQNLLQCQIRNDNHLADAVKMQTIDSLVKCVKDRCGNSIPVELESISSMLDTATWKKGNLFQLEHVAANGLKSYAATDWIDQELQDIIMSKWVSDQLKYAGVDTDDLLIEWCALKRNIPSLKLNWQSTSDTDCYSPLTWANIFAKLPVKSYENLIMFVDFLGAFGLSSAEAERGFSQLKVIKTDKRTCLHQSPLQDQLLVKLEGPEVDKFDPAEAIKAWASSILDSETGKTVRSKRPSFMDSQTAHFGPKLKKTKA